MSSLLNVGARALLANQIGLATTGHNIANVGTAGYSRQSIVQSQVAGQYSGAGYIGKGVEVVGIERAHNTFLTRQAALAQSVQAMDATRSDRLASLSDIMAGGPSGLGAAVNDLVNAFSDVKSVPTDVTARSVVITRADEMAARFRDSQSRLDDLQRGASAELGSSVTQINALGAQIASLNEQIARSRGDNQSPNDLLDQRDQAMRNLNQQVQATSVTASDGTLSVFVGSQALVLGASNAAMGVVTAADGSSQLTLTRGALVGRIDAESLGGGSVAGLLHFQNHDLVEARDGLGRMALAIASEVNAQHRLGVDLDNHAGGDFFTPIAVPNAQPDAGNTGNAVVGASVGDASALVASSYTIRFGASGSVDVKRLSDGKTQSFTGPTPIQMDGLTIDVASGTAAAGDSFVLRPFAAAAGNMQTAITSPRELAAASAVEARADPANSGSIAVQSITASQADPNLGAPVTLTFTSAGTYDVSGAGTGNPTGLVYTPGQAINFNGWTLTPAGTPKAGDVLTVQAATPGFTRLNGGNADALLALRDKTLFDGAPLVDGYAALMAQVGTRAQGAQYAAQISGSIAASLESERTSVSGVNLDEEAAKLLQYQQAYQASAKMIQIAQNIFDSLLQGVN